MPLLLIYFPLRFEAAGLVTGRASGLEERG